MRTAPSLILLLLVCLGGCSSLNKKNNPGLPANPGSDVPPAAFPTSGDPILSGAGAPGIGQAVIAGRVLDEYGRPASHSHIRLVAMSEREAAAAIEVAASPEGYFTVPGLKPGVDYKLIARTKNSELALAGQTQTTAPNVRVVIQMNRDLVGAVTPDVPAADSKPDPKTSSLGIPQASPPAWKPGTPVASTVPREESPRLSVEHDLPAVRVPSPPSAPPAPPQFVPGITATEKAWPPTMDASPKVPAIGGAGSGTTLGPARVPSCVLVGKQLINFALSDINGDPWEFRTHRKGKLVLLDFWGTECIPCQETLPELAGLHLKYGGRGLEVIGLAYERIGTPAEKAYRVNAVCQRKNISYRQLLGGDHTCPVRTQFGIRYIPTLVLVDESGWILWRHEGRPDRAALDELERWIQRRLPKT